MRKTIYSLLLSFVLVSSVSIFAKDRTMVEFKADGFLSIWSNHPDSIFDDFDILKIDKKQHTVTAIVTTKGQETLSQKNIEFKILKTGQEMDDERIDPEYLDYNEVTTLIDNLETAHPNILKKYALATTSEGRTVWAVKISDNVNIEEPESNILVLGLHHAREIMSVEIATDMIEYLATNYGSVSEVTEWVNHWQIWVIPMLNPDGNAYCWSDDPYWIKNRRDLGGDVYGVDLDHNYPLDWGACFGSSSNPNSDAYRGPEAASEPEIQGVLQLAEDHNFLVVLSYHSFNEFVISPYGCTNSTPPEDAIISNFSSSFASEIRKDDGSYGYETGKWWEILYPSDGNETDYFYANYGSMAYAIEVNASEYLPSYSIRNSTVNYNRAGWQKVLNLFDDGNVVYGVIRDACTNEPIVAEFSFAEYPLTEKENPHNSDPVTGGYSCVGKPGPLTLKIHADGYLDRSVPLNFANSPIEKNIDMIPMDEPGLVIWSTQVDDSATGDGDLLLDPGEEAIFKISLMAPGLPVSGISATLTTTDPHLTILDGDATWEDIPAGQTRWSSENHFRIRAALGTPDGYAAPMTLTFTTNEDLCDHEDSTSVLIQSYLYLCPFWGDTFDTDPNWIITAYPTSGSPPDPNGNWAFGVPQSGPPGAYTGSNVYGTNLNGNYDDNWTLCLTTPPIDCSQLTEATLQFARFLQVEPDYDRGRIRIRNTPEGSWTTIFDSEENLFTNDTQWVPVEMDISQYADGQDSVEIRFDVRADYTISYPGFYLDDVFICGVFHGAITPSPTPTFPATSTPTPTPTIPTPTPTPTQFCVNDGDVDNSGALTPQDALSAFQIYLGVIPNPSETELCAADCNASTTVTPEDALCIFRHYLSNSCDCMDSVSSFNGNNFEIILPKSGNHILKSNKTCQVKMELTIDNISELDAFGIRCVIPENCNFVSFQPESQFVDWPFLEAAESDGVLTIAGFNPAETVEGNNIRVGTFTFNRAFMNDKSINANWDLIEVVDDLTESSIRFTEIE